MTRLLLLLWAGVTVSTAVDLQKRIINGQPCGANERHYHVKFIDENNILHCGGSLISQKYILTAAHCWTLGMRAVVGVHGPGPQDVQIIKTMPEIYGDNNKHAHDIMLLKLQNPVTHIPPIALPDREACRNRPRVGDTVQIAGHGATGLIGNTNERDTDVRRLPAALHCANIPIVDCRNLRATMQNLPLFNEIHGFQHFFCGQSPNPNRANPQPRVDLSPGDSGGGVEFNGMIHGVNSFNGYRYAFVHPSAFMDVCEYMKWIEGTVGIGILNKIRKAFRESLRPR